MLLIAMSTSVTGRAGLSHHLEIGLLTLFIGFD